MAYSGLSGQFVRLGSASSVLDGSNSTTRRRAERGELPGTRLPDGTWLFELVDVLALRSRLDETPRRGRRKAVTA